MTLLDSLLDAIVRLDGDSLVMHVGEKPYVVTTSSSMNSFRGPLSWGQVELSSRPLTADAVLGMLGQILPPEQLHVLEDVGAIEHELASSAEGVPTFILTAARGGDDIWVEVRRKPVIVEAPAVEAAEASPDATTVELPVEEPVVVHAPVEEPLVEMPLPAVAETVQIAPSLEVHGAEELPEFVIVEEPGATDAVAEEPSLDETGEIELVFDEAPIEEPAAAAATVEEPAVTLVEEYAQAPEFELTLDEGSGVEIAFAGPPVEEPLVAEGPVFEIMAEAPPPEAAVQEPEAVAIEPVAEVESQPAAVEAAAAEVPASPPAVAAMASEAPPVGRVWARRPEPPSDLPWVMEVPDDLIYADVPEDLEWTPAEPFVEGRRTTDRRTATSAAAPIARPEVAAPEPVVAAIPEPEPVVVPESIFAAVPEPEPVAVLEPVVATAPEPEPVAVPELVVAAVPEPEPVVVPEPVVAAVPEPEPVVVPEPVVAAVPEPEPVVVPEPVVAAVPEPEPVAVPEPVVAAVPEPEPVAVPEPVVATTPEPEPVVAAVPEPEPVAVPELIAAAIPIEEEIPALAAFAPAQEEMPEEIYAADEAHAAPIEAAEPAPPVVVPISKPALKLRPTPPPAAVEVPSASTEASLVGVLKAAAARGASTVYAVADSRPMIRLDGKIAVLGIEAAVTGAEVDRFTFEFAPRDQVAEETSEWTCSIKGVGRVRCVTFHDDSGTGLIFHLPSGTISTADELGLSPRVQALCEEADGLVVIAGPRDSGKSTILDAFVDLINRTRNDHVITIESQIRTTHEKRHSFISQRRAEPDGGAIAAAARAALREGPDVLVIEDLRAPEALSVALDAARAGRLVFGGIAAPTAAAAVGRLVGAFPNDRRSQVRALLAGSLRAVVAQTLVRKPNGGRAGARELLLNSPAVDKLILDGSIPQLALAIEGGRRLGMVTMNDALGALVREGVVEVAEAVRCAPDRGSLIAALERDGIDVSDVERRA